MKIVVSPAKTLDFESPLPVGTYTMPRFLKETEILNETLRKKSPKKLADLMSISRTLAELNFERNQTRVVDYSPENARQAVFAFKGDVYLGLDAYTLDPGQIEQLQGKLRILSGLYGLLKPLDLIQPYRLEMGTQLKVGRKPNLYKFWDKKITEALNEELADGEPLINLASQEYFGAVKPEHLKSEVITPHFKEYKEGEFKIISFFAKKARGLMTRFVIDKNIDQAEDLKTFNYEGYEFDSKLSGEKDWVFVR